MRTIFKSELGGRTSAQIRVGRLLVPVAMLLFWELLSFWVGTDLVPDIDQTYGAIQSGIAAGWYLPNLQNSLIALGLGFLLAALGGFVIGVALGLNDTLFELFEPFVLNTYAIPKVVLYPLFLFVFQVGMDQKVAFAAMHGFFPMVIITMSAIQTIPNIYLKVGRSLMMTQYQVARHVIAPYLVVQLIVGIRLAFSLTFLGVILAELFAANTGIGLQLRHAMANFDTQKIMAIVTVLMLIAFIGNITFYLIQRSLERRWNLSARETL